MKHTSKRPPSVLVAREGAIATVLPAGLPPAVRAFYAEGDGLEVELEIDGEPEQASIVGLDAMFGGEGEYLRYEPLGAKASYEEVTERLASGGPFEDTFFSTSDEELTGAKQRARIDLLLRLRLLAQIEGESSALGIDLYGEGAPAIYLVEDARTPHRIDVDFAGFVRWFATFGTRRWYYAFMSKASEREMGITFRDEIEDSLAGFDPADVAALKEAGKRAAAAAKAAKASKPTQPHA